MNLCLQLFSIPADFATSRNTWFTQDDVNELKSLGINTVRIPVSWTLQNSETKLICYSLATGLLKHWLTVELSFILEVESSNWWVEFGID